MHTSELTATKRSPAPVEGGWRAWRSVLMPSEHGGWGFLLEPLLLGLLVAPSAAGWMLSLATVAAFLMRQPLKLRLVDRRRGLHTARTRRATAVSGGLAGIAAAGFGAALWQAGPAFLLPLLLALPFGAVFLYYDLTKPGRTLQAELAAPPALAFVASAMAVMDGWALPAALALWAALTLRAVPSVLYVRARIRLDRGRAPSLLGPIAWHGAALLVAAALVWWALLPAVVLVAYAVLLARAAWFLSPARPRVTVKTIGFIELGLGILFVFLLASGL